MAYDRETNKPKNPDAFNAVGRYHVRICQQLEIEPSGFITKHIYNYDPDEIITRDDEIIEKYLGATIKRSTIKRRSK